MQYMAKNQICILCEQSKQHIIVVEVFLVNAKAGSTDAHVFSTQHHAARSFMQSMEASKTSAG